MIALAKRYIFWKMVWHPTWHWKATSINLICLNLCQMSSKIYAIFCEEGGGRTLKDHNGSQGGGGEVKMGQKRIAYIWTLSFLWSQLGLSENPPKCMFPPTIIYDAHPMHNALPYFYYCSDWSKLQVLTPRFGPQRNSKMPFDLHPQQTFGMVLGLVGGSYLICRPI